jgi:hypothetical protein
LELFQRTIKLLDFGVISTLFILLGTHICVCLCFITFSQPFLSYMNVSSLMWVLLLGDGTALYI